MASDSASAVSTSNDPTKVKKRKAKRCQEERQEKSAPLTPDEGAAKPKKRKKDKAKKKGEAAVEQEGAKEGEKRLPKRPKNKEGQKKKKQKKKAAAAAAATAAAEQKEHESVGQNKALRYLSTWADDRDEWKFAKVRQTWLLQHAYDEKKIPSDRFDSLVQYMASIRGGTRERVLESAREKLARDAKWQGLLDEGKSEVEVTLELKTTRQAKWLVDRAKQIADALE